VKLEDNLRQIKKRIAELQRKAEWIELQLSPPATKAVDISEYVLEVPEYVAEAVEAEVLVEQPRRRGRRKLNETE
jgi:hypothetical protein